MSDETEVSKSEEQRWRSHNTMRLIYASTFGIIATLLTSGAFQAGAQFSFRQVEAVETWRLLLWGEHYVLVVLASLLSTALGAYIAGLVARRKGGMVGVILAIPKTLAWGFLLYLSISSGRQVSLGNKIAATLLTLLSIPCACIAAPVGAQAGQSLANHFDGRPYTLLGIKWYHYLWIPFALNIILVQTASVLIYTSGWVVISWTEGPFSIIPGIFLLGIYATLVLTANGVRKAYRILAGLDYIPSVKARALNVLKFGCGWPLLAGAIQSGIALLHWGLAKLFS